MEQYYIPAEEFTLNNIDFQTLHRELFRLERIAWDHLVQPQIYHIIQTLSYK